MAGHCDSENLIRRLTAAQLACLRLVGTGPSKAIGRALGISHHTVDEHLKVAMKRLNVDSRFEAARLVAAWEAKEAPPKAWGHQSDRIAPAVRPGILEASSTPYADAELLDQIPGVREVRAEFGLNESQSHRPESWKFRRWLNSGGNDLNVAGRIRWMSLMLLGTVAALFLMLAAAESLQRTVMELLGS